MHISIFHSIKDPVVGHRFAYCTLAEDLAPGGVLAHVAFYNATTMTSGTGSVLIKQGEMPSSDDILKLYCERTFTQLESDEVVEELRLALNAEAHKRASEFTRRHLKDLCTDVYDWQVKGLLAPNSTVAQLRSICIEYHGKEDSFQEAERIISLEAMKYVVEN